MDGTITACVVVEVHVNGAAVLQEDVSVPARSQVGVPGKIVFRGRPESQDKLWWGTKPTTIAKGVHVARTLTSVDQFDDLPVRLMNV